MFLFWMMCVNKLITFYVAIATKDVISKKKEKNF